MEKTKGCRLITLFVFLLSQKLWDKGNSKENEEDKGKSSAKKEEIKEDYKGYGNPKLSDHNTVFFSCSTCNGKGILKP